MNLTADQLRTFIRDAVSVQYDLNGVMRERAADVACHVKAMAAEIERLSAEVARLEPLAAREIAEQDAIRELFP